jgi:hypothetical protein
MALPEIGQARMLADKLQSAVRTPCTKLDVIIALARGLGIVRGLDYQTRQDEVYRSPKLVRSE